VPIFAINPNFRSLRNSCVNSFTEIHHLIQSPKDNIRAPLKIQFNHTMLAGYTIFFRYTFFLTKNHPIFAHRTPDNTHKYTKTEIDRCLRCIITSGIYQNIFLLPHLR